MKKILNEMEAYHGSPYDFDKFQVKYLGKGEGCQAHGYGLYFALNPDIADNYSESLDNKDGISEIEYNGKTYKVESIQGILLKSILKNKEMFLETINAVLSDKKWIKAHQKILPKLQKVLKVAQKINPEKIKKIRNKITLRKGQVYTVNIPELEYFIKENEPITKQSDFFKEIYNKCWDMYLEYKNKNKLNELPSYISFWKYQTENNKWNAAPNKKTALALRKLGVMGVYYDGSNDGKCVTIFSPQDIKITNKKFDYKLKNNDNINALYNSNITSAVQGDEKLNKASKEIRRIAIQNNPYNIQYIENPTEEEQLLALELSESRDYANYYLNNGHILQFIKNPTEKVQLEAIKKWKGSIQFIKNPTEKVQLEYDKRYGKNIFNRINKYY